MLWIVIVFVVLAIIFLSLANRWEGSIPRALLTSYPRVSILIPAYKSEDTIRETLQSVKELDYPDKEVIVVNDYPDRTSEIAREFGFRVIDHRERQGKARSLNEAVEKCSGDILFFLDSDTTVKRNCLRKLMPWFSKKRVAAVAPKYVAKNRKGLVPRLVSLENSYNSTMFKMHMCFGTMISFRGCGIAIRRSAFQKLGAWSQTLIEDTDFAAKAIKNGYRILYEPSAMVETYEPHTLRGLIKQKLRWGRGAGFAIFNNRDAYSSSRGALFHFMPYLFLNLAIIFSFFWQLISYLPTLSFLYSHFPLHIFAYAFLQITAPPLLMLTAAVFAAVTIHNLILMWPERLSAGDALYIPLYTILYLPLVLLVYVGGIAIGITERIRHKPEIDFRHW